MLRELHISNLAVIEDVTIDLDHGLNCFTGQTGAGKSLILGAFEILLGLKTGGAEMLRPGVEEARVSGVFELREKSLAAAVAGAADLTIEPGEPLLITRKFFASGRSSASVNGQPATASMIRAIGEVLVDVHGQHDHQYLLRPSNQLLVLDEFGRSTGLRERHDEQYAKLRGLRQRREELNSSQTLRRQQLELYEFQAEEIDAAALQPGEMEQRRARHLLLSNLARVKKEAGAAHAAMYESQGAVIERLQAIAHVLEGLGEIDAALKEKAEMVKAATVALQEVAFDVGRYVERLELDPRELAEVEERLNLLHRLVQKYAPPGLRALAPAPGSADVPRPTENPVDSMQVVLSYRHWLAGEIERLRAADVDASGIDAQIAVIAKELSAIGAELLAARQAAAKKLRPLIEKQMHELGMAEAEFAVEFPPPPELTDGAIGPGVLPGAGARAIEMMVRTNPGQPARPLRKIASGGEMSRIMLALKSILAQADRVSVLVFDEIDANVGGRLGTVLGQKLRALAHGAATTEGPRPLPYGRGSSEKAGGGNSGGGQQVLCITHLPQIAAFADRHVRITKQVAGEGKEKATRTTVQVLAGEARIDELAEMLAGSAATQTTREQAREMLGAASSGDDRAEGGMRQVDGASEEITAHDPSARKNKKSSKAPSGRRAHGR